MAHVCLLDDEEDMGVIYDCFFRKEIKNQIFSIEHFTDTSAYFFALEKGLQCNLLICDINMPRKNGFQVLSELKLIGYQFPVLMVSAYDSKEYLNQAKELGAESFVTKPIDFGLLKKTILTLLNLHREQ